MNIINVPKKFQPILNIKYPPYVKGHMIEAYFYNHFIKNNIKTERYYLPIFWTDFYISRKYGKNIKDLQEYIDNLDNTKKYFTITQYDSGILNNLSHLDIFICSSGGGGRSHNINISKYYEGELGDIILPLLANPMKTYDVNKTILCSFLGSFASDQGLLRNKMKLFFEKKKEYVISSTKNINDYFNIMSKSKYALCPRGFGYTSYRLYEALYCNCIPIYIWQGKKCLPYENELNWDDFSIIVHMNDIEKIPDLINNIDEKKYNKMIQTIKELIPKYFTMDACCNYIVHKMK